MGPAVLFFLVLVAAAPLLSAAQNKTSTVWINNDASFDSRHSRIIVSSLVPVQQTLIAAGFFCVTSTYSLSTCDEFLFAVSIIGNAAVLGTQQVLWSANRDRPVRENATLELTTGGNLVLRDADGGHVWSSNNSGRSVDGMKITEIGNLVLFDHKNATVWQSFDHPTDTMVRGQSLVEGMSLTTATSLKLERGLVHPVWVPSTESGSFIVIPKSDTVDSESIEQWWPTGEVEAGEAEALEELLACVPEAADAARC